MPQLDSRAHLLTSLLEERILVVDGAMGTAIQAKDLHADDFGGPELDGCNEVLVESRPDVIRAIHREYLDAGADIIETDTFGGTPLVLAEYGLADRARELNRIAAKLAAEAAHEYSTKERPRFAAARSGRRQRRSRSPAADLRGLRDHFREQMVGLSRAASTSS
jgi:5-methyltetrahydrofolate--homocysteine methyltransferase